MKVRGEAMIVDRLKETPNLTVQEQAVVDYILEKPRALLKMSIHDLAASSYTSAATIIRLCKKIGTSGYSEFKTLYISEYPELMKLNENLKTEPFNGSSSIDDIIHALPMLVSKSMDYTRSVLDRNTIVRCLHHMRSADHIEIYGNGINYHIAQMYAHRFEEVGVHAIAYDTTHWMHVAYNKKKKKNTFAILISHTGRNPGILDTAKWLNEFSIPSLAICGKVDRRLSQLTNETLQIMTSAGILELNTLLFTQSTMYILEIFVNQMLVNNFDQVKEIAANLSNSKSRWQND